MSPIVDAAIPAQVGRSADAWERFYATLEENARLNEELLATGGPLESIRWAQIAAPADSVPPRFAHRHARLLHRLAALSAATESALDGVAHTLAGLPHHGPAPDGAGPVGLEIDVFG